MSPKGKFFSDNHCTKCGRRFRSRDTFCIKCGNPLRIGADRPSLQEEEAAEPATIEFSLNDTPLDLESVIPILAERHYIGAQYDRYMKVFSGLREKRSLVSWNWSAFLSGPFWFVYRKLYLPGLFLIVICLAALAVNIWLIFPVYLLECLFAGLFGDALMRWRICRLIEQGRTLVEPYRSRHIQKKGGVQAGLTGLLLSLFLILCISRFTFAFMPPALPVVSNVSSTCVQPGCSLSATTDGTYCHEHTCMADSCTQKRQMGSRYCTEHLWMDNVCADPGCQEETVEDGMYCPAHTCMFEGCVAHRAYESELCTAHTPDTPTASAEE